MALLTDNECASIIGLPATTALVTLLRPMVEAAIETIIGYRIEERGHTEYYPDSDVAAIGRNEFVDTQGGKAVVFQERPNAGRVLSLRNFPLRRNGLAVYEHYGAKGGLGESPWPSSTLLTLGTDYYADFDQDNLCRSGQLIRNAGSWSVEPRSIKVIYRAGYTASELSTSDADVRVADIKMWALISFQSIYNQVKRNQVGTGSIAPGDKASESIGNYSYSLGGAGAQSFQTMIPPAARAGLQPYVSYRRLLGAW